MEYAFRSTEEYPNFVFAISHGDVVMAAEDFTFSNAVLNTFNYGGVRTVLNFTPSDPHKPVGVYYKKWYVMQCNY